MISKKTFWWPGTVFSAKHIFQLSKYVCSFCHVTHARGCHCGCRAVKFDYLWLKSHVPNRLVSAVRECNLINGIAQRKCSWFSFARPSMIMPIYLSALCDPLPHMGLFSGYWNIWGYITVMCVIVWLPMYKGSNAEWNGIYQLLTKSTPDAKKHGWYIYIPEMYCTIYYFLCYILSPLPFW